MEHYSLEDSYVTGGGGFMKSVQGFAQKWVGPHVLLTFVLLIVLVIIVIWLLATRKEGFNPTQTVRDQDSDQWAFTKKEGLANPFSRGQSAFAQQVQSGSGQFAYDPAAAANQPGSIAWQVLHSSDFDCANRKAVGDDAWAWMNGVAHESMQGEKPKTDNEFSQVLTGH